MILSLLTGPALADPQADTRGYNNPNRMGPGPAMPGLDEMLDDVPPPDLTHRLTDRFIIKYKSAGKEKGVTGVIAIAAGTTWSYPAETVSI